MKDIVAKALSSEYLSTRMQASYMRNTRFDELCMNGGVILLLLETLSTDGRTGRNLGKWRLESLFFVSVCTTKFS